MLPLSHSFLPSQGLSGREPGDLTDFPISIRGNPISHAPPSLPHKPHGLSGEAWMHLR